MLRDLAVLYREQGRYDEARLLFEQALAIQEVKLPADHPEIIETVEELNLLRRVSNR